METFVFAKLSEVIEKVKDVAE
jgi:hypothetical protein